MDLAEIQHQWTRDMLETSIDRPEATFFWSQSNRSSDCKHTNVLTQRGMHPFATCLESYGAYCVVGRATNFVCGYVVLVWSLPVAPSRCGRGPSGPELLGWLINQLDNPSFPTQTALSIWQGSGGIYSHACVGYCFDSESLLPAFSMVSKLTLKSLNFKRGHTIKVMYAVAVPGLPAPPSR